MATENPFREVLSDSDYTTLFHQGLVVEGEFPEVTQVSETQVSKEDRQAGPGEWSVVQVKAIVAQGLTAFVPIAKGESFVERG